MYGRAENIVRRMREMKKESPEKISGLLAYEKRLACRECASFIRALIRAP